MSVPRLASGTLEGLCSLNSAGQGATDGPGSPLTLPTEAGSDKWPSDLVTQQHGHPCPQGKWWGLQAAGIVSTLEAHLPSLASTGPPTEAPAPGPHDPLGLPHRGYHSCLSPTTGNPKVCDSCPHYQPGRALGRPRTHKLIQNPICRGLAQTGAARGPLSRPAPATEHHGRR